MCLENMVYHFLSLLSRARYAEQETVTRGHKGIFCIDSYSVPLIFPRFPSLAFCMDVGRLSCPRGYLLL